MINHFKVGVCFISSPIDVSLKGILLAGGGNKERVVGAGDAKPYLNVPNDSVAHPQLGISAVAVFMEDLVPILPV